MRVLYFGTYERGYPRNAQVISCLRKAGVEVAERHAPVWEGRTHKFGERAGAAVRLIRAEAALLRRPRMQFDAVIIGYPGHFDMPAAKRAARGRPVILNPLVSLKDTLVEDRALFARDSIAARLLGRVDRAAFRSAALVVADTEEHARLFRELGARRVEVCLVGAEERVFQPGWQMREPFTALFVGKLIPLHGIDTVLDAARRAPEVQFRVIGSGQLERALETRPPNVDWLRWVEYAQLPAHLRTCGCALGIFGTTAKARRVIPNKVFQALACGAPVITADTPAIRELDEQGLLLVPAGDARQLASAVRLLAKDGALRADLSARGLTTYNTRASEAILGARWRALIEELL